MAGHLMPAGTNIAQQQVAADLIEEVQAGMKQLGNDLAQLAAIIMLMITLAITTAAFSQWASPEAEADGSQRAQPEVAASTLSASVTP
jgi:hypothetical protein